MLCSRTSASVQFLHFELGRRSCKSQFAKPVYFRLRWGVKKVMSVGKIFWVTQGFREVLSSFKWLLQQQFRVGELKWIKEMTSQPLTEPNEPDITQFTKLLICPCRDSILVSWDVNEWLTSEKDYANSKGGQFASSPLKRTVSLLSQFTLETLTKNNGKSLFSSPPTSKQQQQSFFLSCVSLWNWVTRLRQKKQRLLRRRHQFDSYSREEGERAREDDDAWSTRRRR